MTQKAGYNVIVGFFVLTGILILTAMVFAFGGGRSFFADTYTVNAVFPDGVVGVQPGQSVTLGGKRVGETVDVRFVDPQRLEKGVVVVIAALKDFALPAACELGVTSNIMGFGRPVLQLKIKDPNDTRHLPTDGTAEILGRTLNPLDSIIPKQTQMTLEKATADIGDLAASLKPVADNLARMLESRQLTDVDAKAVNANIDTVVQRLDAALKSIDAIAGDADNQANIKAAVANARTMTESGVKVTEDLRAFTSEGKQAAAQATVFLQKLTTVAEQMSSVASHMDTALARMNEGKGTVGLMMNDNRLYEEMLLTFRRMTKMMDDMREVLDLAKKGQLRIKAF